MVVMELHITVRGREGGWYKPDNGEAADIGLNIGCGVRGLPLLRTTEGNSAEHKLIINMGYFMNPCRIRR